VTKPSDFMIVPPWSNNSSNNSTYTINHAYGTYEHQGTNSSTYSNDYYALDFKLQLDEAVYSVAPGVVVYAGPATNGWKTYGNIVYIDHQNGYESLYAHLNSISVSTGQSVGTSTRLGGAGGSGGWPVHLHFALYKGAHFQNASYGIGPYGGQAVVPEPFANCTKNSSGSCENFVTGDVLAKGSNSPPSNACSPPSLNSPSDGETVSSRMVNFSWQGLSGCTFSGYTFRVKDTSNMDSGGTTIVDTGEGNTSHQATINGRDDQDLYWGVRAANAPSGAPWSVRRFRIHVASACSGPSLNSPQDGQTLSSRTVTFSWQGLGGCTFNGYTFRVKTVPDMDSGGTQIIDTGDGGASWTATFDSQWDDTDLYWGVRAANASNGANWSVRRFRIHIDPACSGPVLNSPQDGQTLSSRMVTFDWQGISGCTFNGYTFRVKTVSDMDSGGTQIIDTGDSNASWTANFNSQWDDTDLYWGVRAANAPAGASWSVRRFRIHVASPCPGPTLNSPADGQTLSSQIATFDWQSLGGCTFSGYTFRIKTVPDMDSGGTQIIDTGDGSTSWSATFDPQWDNQDLYWGVRAANASAGASWSVRRFRISPDSQPPTVTPTDTPTVTPTDTPTVTPTDTPTVTPTDTPMNTPIGTATATPSPPTGGYQMNVPATQAWIDTGIQAPSYPATGFTDRFDAWGAIHTTADFGPAGNPSCTAPTGWVAPGLPCYALIGRFGADGTPFFIGPFSYSGDQNALPHPATLYLSVNGPVSGLSGNTGSWTVNVTFNVDGYWPTTTPTPSSLRWPIQSVDSMKVTKDQLCNQPDTAWIDHWLDKAVELGMNYVTVDTPYDNPPCGGGTTANAALASS